MSTSLSETSATSSHAIIGSSAGIGFSLASRAVDAGQNVYGVSRGPSDLKSTNYTHLIGDARSPEAYVDLFPKKIDYLTFCPGQIFLGSLRRTKPEDLLNTFESNVVDAFRVIQSLRNRITQSIVLISSVAAKVGIPNHAAISASKSALDGLVRTMAAELSPGIRINAVAPTLTPTDTATQLVGGQHALPRLAHLHPMKALPSSDEVASAIHYFHTQAHSVTGQILMIDSGMSFLHVR
jgi:3-oxoacyl-[acyl-carrier protein] reductase